MKIETEQGLQKLPDGTEERIEVNILHRVVDLVGAVKRLHKALAPGGQLFVGGPTGESCWNDPRCKREIHPDLFRSFGRLSEDVDLPHFTYVTVSNGQVELIK